MTIFEHDQPPEHGPGDTAHAVVKAALGSVPLVGAGAAELFAAIITAPLERRRQEWATEVGERLRQLEARKVLNLEDLPEDQDFLDIAFQATQAAMRTSQQEKRQALQNALLNAARPNAIDVEQQAVFVNLIDTLTDWHIRILRAFGDQGAHQRGMGALWHVVVAAYPDMAAHRDRVEQVCSELHARGLITNKDIHTTLSDVGASKRTTGLGDRFLAFISSPLESE